MHYPPATATIHQLENGLTVILDSRSNHPVVSVQLWVETGSIHEEKSLGAGLSHFLEHMVFKGTEKHSGDSLASLVTAAGGHWNAYTTFDRTVYYIDGTSQGVDTYLEVLTEMVYRPTLQKDDFEKEKEVIRREIDMGLDDPHSRATRLLLSTAFRQDARSLPVIGERALFDRITHDDLVNYYRERYTVNRSFYVVSGDFEKDDMLEKMKRLTEDLAVGNFYEPHIANEESQCSLLRGEDFFDIPSAKLTFAWKVPSLGHRDSPAYDLLSAILGAGRSSPLVQTLRERKQLALEISAWNWTSFQGAGLFAISAECDAEKISLLEKEILILLENTEEKFLSAHLAKAKRQLTIQQLRPLTTASGRASDLASNWHETRNLNFTHDYVLALQKVTAADLLRCLRSLKEQTLTITVLKPQCAEQESHTLAKKSTVTSSAITLSNQLPVSFFPDDSLPLVSLQCVVRSGLLSEEIPTSGINQLLASTLTHGTKTRDSFTIASTLDQLGASIHATAGNNCIIIGASCLGDDLPTILSLLADIILHPIFPSDAVEREKSSQLSSLKESLTDPIDLAFLSLRKALFSEQGYGLALMGSLASLPTLSSQSLSEHHATYFTADQMALSIAGAFSPLEMQNLLEKHFSQLPRTRQKKSSQSIIKTPQLCEQYLDKKQAVLTVGYPAAALGDESRFAQQLIHHYLADMAGPLFMKIREEHGLAYQVGATHFLGIDAGMFACYLSTSPEQLDFAKQELLAELQRIQNQGMSEEEFRNHKTALLSAQALSQQSPATLARQSALDMLFTMPHDQYLNHQQRISSLTLDEVNQSLAKLFSQQPVISIVRGSHEA